MTCAELLEHADDLAEGGADPSQRDAIERHLAECEACRALVADLRRIRQAAAALEAQPLPPALWGRVVERLELDEAFQRAAARQERRRRTSWAWLAAAAMLLLAVGIGIWSVTRAVPTAPEGTQAAGGAGGDASPKALVENVEAELQLAAAHYENAIKGLEQVANTTDSPLDPTLMATLKQNLALIDRAIDESRVALRTDPESRVAQENLFEAFRRKIALLQDTIALMNEMRKGNEAGTARVVEQLNKS